MMMIVRAAPGDEYQRDKHQMASERYTIASRRSHWQPPWDGTHPRTHTGSCSGMAFGTGDM